MKNLILCLLILLPCSKISAQNVRSFKFVGYVYSYTDGRVALTNDAGDTTFITNKDILKQELDTANIFSFKNPEKTILLTLKYGTVLKRGSEKILINEQILGWNNCMECCVKRGCCSGMVAHCGSGGCFPNPCYSCILTSGGCVK